MKSEILSILDLKMLVKIKQKSVIKPTPTIGWLFHGTIYYRAVVDVMV